MAENDPATEEVDARLMAERPVPVASFRSELRRRLLGVADEAPERRRVRRLVAAYAFSGAALLAIVAISIAGAGPLASP